MAKRELLAATATQSVEGTRHLHATLNTNFACTEGWHLIARSGQLTWRNNKSALTPAFPLLLSAGLPLPAAFCQCQQRHKSSKARKFRAIQKAKKKREEKTIARRKRELSAKFILTSQTFGVGQDRAAIKVPKCHFWLPQSLAFY